MNPAHVAHVCQQVFPEGSVLVADGGNAAVWTMMFHQARVPNTILSTFKFGMLGAGVAQATGRRGRAARTSRSAASSATAPWASTRRKSRPPCATACGSSSSCVCDKQWGMVKMNQQFALKPIKTLIKKSLGPDETIKADLGEIRFDELARAMGAHGERVADPRELKAAIERSLASGGPGGHPRGRGPGEAHVGARPDALQGHAPGAEGEMTEIDAVRLNFSPESLVALNFILAFVMFGVALDMKPADFQGITAAPRAVLIGMIAQFLLLPAAAWALTMVLQPAAEHRARH